MKLISSILLSSVLFLGSISMAFAAPTSPVGTWKTINAQGVARSLVQIDVNNGVVSGRVVKILVPGKGQDAVCVNCTGSNKDKPIVGMTVIWGQKDAGNGAWEGGNIMDIETGKVHPCYFQLSPNGKSMNVTIKSGLFSRTLTWPRM